MPHSRHSPESMFLQDVVVDLLASAMPTRGDKSRLAHSAAMKPAALSRILTGGTRRNPPHAAGGHRRHRLSSAPSSRAQRTSRFGAPRFAAGLRRRRHLPRTGASEARVRAPAALGSVHRVHTAVWPPASLPIPHDLGAHEVRPQRLRRSHAYPRRHARNHRIRTPHRGRQEVARTRRTYRSSAQERIHSLG